MCLSNLFHLWGLYEVYAVLSATDKASPMLKASPSVIIDEQIFYLNWIPECEEQSANS